MGEQTPRKRTPGRSGEPDPGTPPDGSSVSESSTDGSGSQSASGADAPKARRSGRPSGQGALGNIASQRVAAAAAAAGAISGPAPTAGSADAAKAETPTAEQTLAAAADDHAAGSKSVSGEAAVEKDAVAIAASAAAAAAVAAVNAAIAATAATKATRADKARLDGAAASATSQAAASPAPAAPVKAAPAGAKSAPSLIPPPQSLPPAQTLAPKAPPTSFQAAVEARKTGFEAPSAPAADDPTARYSRPGAAAAAAAAAAATPPTPPATAPGIPNIPGIVRRETLDNAPAAAAQWTGPVPAAAPPPEIRSTTVSAAGSVPNIPGIVRRETLQATSSDTPVVPTGYTAGAAKAAEVIAAAAGKPLTPADAAPATLTPVPGIPAIPGITRREQVTGGTSAASQTAIVTGRHYTPDPVETQAVKPPPLFSNEGIVRDAETHRPKGVAGFLSGLAALLLFPATALGHSVSTLLSGGTASPDFDRSGKPKKSGRRVKVLVALGGMAAVLILAAAVVPILAPTSQGHQPQNNQGSPDPSLVANADKSHDPNVVGPGGTEDPSLDPGGVEIGDESLAPGATRKPTKSPGQNPSGTPAPSLPPGVTPSPSPTPGPTLPPGATPTPTPVPTPTPDPTPTPPPTPVPTPTPTPVMFATLMLRTAPTTNPGNATFDLATVPGALCQLVRRPVPIQDPVTRKSSWFTVADGGFVPQWGASWTKIGSVTVSVYTVCTMPAPDGRSATSDDVLVLWPPLPPPPTAT